MNALCKAYANIDDADRGVQALLAAAVPGEDVRLLMGAELHDARREAAGGFAGAVATEDRVGAFAGESGDRSAPMGSFAGDSAAGGEGLFANADRDVVVTHSDGQEHSRVAGHRRLKELLIDAGLDESTAETDVRALHDGRVLVLVTLGAVTEDRAREVLGAVG
jgi:hypothetical protein